jgi:exosortase/archaeosortase family protein
VVNSLGFDVFENGRHFGLSGSGGVNLGAPCNGLSLMYVYAAFLLAFPLSFRKKLPWLVLGLPLIQLLNLLRIVALLLLSLYRPTSLEFNHDYTFTLIMYGLIFLSWYVYIRMNSERP